MYHKLVDDSVEGRFRVAEVIVGAVAQLAETVGAVSPAEAGGMSGRVLLFASLWRSVGEEFYGQSPDRFLANAHIEEAARSICLRHVVFV